MDGAQGNFGGHGNALCIDCGAGYLGVYICKNLGK